MNNLRHAAVICALCVALASTFTAPTFAEVGAFTTTDELVSSYILQIIVDDPEPVSSAWVRYYPDGPKRLVLNDQGYVNGDGAPTALRDSFGDVLVAWARNSPGGYDIVISRFDGAGWTTQQVVADSPLDELDPYLVLDPNDGSIHVLYWVDDGVPRVLHRQAPADLSSWSAPVQVSHPAEIACRPSGVFHDGLLHVAYERHVIGYGMIPREIVLAIDDGQTFLSQVLATNQYAAQNWPEVHSIGGQLWIDWIDTESDMAWTRQSTAGSWEPIRTEHFASAEERDFHVRGLIRILALE